MKILIMLLLMTILNTLLSLCPITVNAGFDKEFSAEVRYLFFHYTITPRPAKKKKKGEAKTEQPAKQKVPKLKILYEKRGLSGFIDFISGLAHIAAGTAKKVFQHLTLSVFSINIAVSSGDAAQTAINYGYVCSAVYPAVSVLLSNTNYKDYTVNVQPDFNSKESSVTFRCKAKIKVIFLFSALIYAFKDFIKLQKSQNA